MYSTPMYRATRDNIRNLVGLQTKRFGTVESSNLGGRKKKKASAWNKFFAKYRRQHPEWSIKRIATEYRRHHGLKKKPKKKKAKKRKKKGGIYHPHHPRALHHPLSTRGGKMPVEIYPRAEFYGKGELMGGLDPIQYMQEVKEAYPYVPPKMALEVGKGVMYQRRGGRLKAKGAKKNLWLQFIQYHKRMPKKFWQDLYAYEKPLYKKFADEPMMVSHALVKKRIPIMLRAPKAEKKKEIKEAIEAVIPKVHPVESIQKQIKDDIIEKMLKEEKAIAEHYAHHYGFDEPEGTGFYGGTSTKKTKKAWRKNAWILFLKKMKKHKLPKKDLHAIYKGKATYSKKKKKVVKLNRWMKFLADFRKKHPNLKAIEASKKAGVAYRKKYGTKKAKKPKKKKKGGSIGYGAMGYGTIGYGYY